MRQIFKRNKNITKLFLLLFFLCCTAFLLIFYIESDKPITKKKQTAAKTTADKPTSISYCVTSLSDEEESTLIYHPTERVLSQFIRKKNQYIRNIWDEKSGWTTNVESWKIKKSETLECTPEIYDKDGNVVEIDGMHIDTKTVKVSVDILKVKKVKVVPALSKELKDYTISATPEYVKISGEIDVLKDINVISTAVVDVSGIKNENEFKTQLLVPTGTKLLDEKDSDITVVIRKEE